MLANLEREIGCIYSGETPQILELRALAHTIAERGLSNQPFLDLLDAFRQDQRKSRYADWAELLDYCRRSANPVGRLVLETVGELGGADAGRKIALSDSICTGLQLANFWQDVAKDFALGRIYIPADAMARHGVDEAAIARGEARPGSAACSRDCAIEPSRSSPRERAGRPDREAAEIPILAFAIAGQELLRRIREAGFDVFHRRPEIGNLPIQKILAKAAAARWIPAFRPK